MGSEKLLHNSPLPIPHSPLPFLIRNPQSSILFPIRGVAVILTLARVL